jgi:hypothetical protein
MILKGLLKITVLYICSCKDMLKFKFCIGLNIKKIHKIMLVIYISYFHSIKVL